MKFFEYIERIEKMHCLIKAKRTGTPDEFAFQLGIRRTRLYEIIDELKSRGAPIAYSKASTTFYYEYPYDIELTCMMQPLTEDEMVEVDGGKIFPFFFCERNASTLALEFKMLTSAG